MQHAKLSASGSSRWINCPGSIEKESFYPNETNDPAEYGTAGHEIAEKCLSAKILDADKYIGYVCENGIVADEQLCHYVQQYLDFVYSVSSDEDSQLYVETRVDFSEYAPEGFGTSDAFVVHTDELHVIDLKLGRVLVYPQSNPQAMLYAVGVLNKIGELIHNIELITITIVQPLKDHIEDWQITKQELLDWAKNVARPAALLALEPDAPLIAGPVQCENCRAAGNCSTLADYCLETFFKGNTVIEKDQMTLEQLADVLSKKSLITKWLKNVEKHSIKKIQQGDCIPGFKMVESVTHRAWDPEVDMIQIAEKMQELGMAEDECISTSLISPANANNALKKNFKYLSEYIVKPPGRPTIAPEKDKRKALELTVKTDKNEEKD